MSVYMRETKAYLCARAVLLTVVLVLILWGPLSLLERIS